MKHGYSYTSTYACWQHMKDRCLNSNSAEYARYGGRGIRVCDRWLRSFKNFLTDMGERPPGLTIERVNNDGDYCPGNCRWATYREQTRNYSLNRIITFQGKTQTVSDWADELGLSRGTVFARLYKHGPDPDKLFKPVRPRMGWSH